MDRGGEALESCGRCRRAERRGVYRYRPRPQRRQMRADGTLCRGQAEEAGCRRRWRRAGSELVQVLAGSRGARLRVPAGEGAAGGSTAASPGVGARLAGGRLGAEACHACLHRASGDDAVAVPAARDDHRIALLKIGQRQGCSGLLLHQRGIGHLHTGLVAAVVAHQQVVGADLADLPEDGAALGLTLPAT